MRGAVARFGLVLALLVVLAVVAGALIHQLVPGFESIGDAVWWAFEHVVVPEYTDGDEGVVKRTVATALIVLGSILFAGAVIAILVQWMDETTARLELGLTPVALDAHFVLLGWNSRTQTIVKEILVSQGRVERFLRRVLVLGWNHRVPLLLSEFSSYPKEKFTIDIVSQVSASRREKRLAIESFAPEQLEIRHLEFDYTVPAYLESVGPAGYDNVVLLASERLKDGTELDARTILGYLLLRQLVGKGAHTPKVLVELADADNVTLFEKRRAEIIVSPVIVSHMLTRVTLRRELRAVFDELFGSGGCEVHFRRIAEYGLAEILSQIPGHGVTGGEYSFADLQRVADARGEIAIGIRRVGQEGTPHGGVALNPGRDDRLEVSDNDELIVLSTDD